MNILTLETSQPQASLCLSKEGNIRFEASWHADRNHDAYLFPALRQALEALEDEPLHVILVGSGPGSYGGIRVALAAAVGIATVTGAKIVAVESWKQLAGADNYIIADARRGGWTVRHPSGMIEVLSAEEIRMIAQSGAAVRTLETREHMEKRGIPAIETDLTPTAAGVLATWNNMTEEERALLCEKPAEPIYVRPPHIVPAKHKPWEIRS